MGRSFNKVRKIAERSTDPREALLSALGDFDDEVFHNGVLCATYIQPAQTASGLYLPDKTIQEDVYQGSIGLVVAMGPGAFKDDGVAQFHGVKLKLHDWVLYQPADGLHMEINEVPCRLFQDTRILMRVKNPSKYW